MKSAVFCFGRFNPLTSAHLQLIERAQALTQTSGDFMVFPSRTSDSNARHPSNRKNPLDFDTKYAILSKMLPMVNIVDDSSVKSPHQVIEYLRSREYDSATFVVGSDRKLEFEQRWLPYALDEFKTAAVVEVMVREALATGIAGMSGTSARLAAIDRDFLKFKIAIGDAISGEMAEHMFEEVCKRLE